MGTQQNTILGFVVLLALIGIIGGVTLYISEKIADKTALTDLTAAVGTFTITTANVTDGKYVNITNAAGVKTTFEFNLNGSTAAAPWAVNVTMAALTAAAASVQLTAKINGNSSTNVDFVATNPTTTTVVITAKTKGIVGNSYALSETETNGSWSGVTLLGGTDLDHYYNASGDVSSSVETGWDFTELIVLAIATGIVLVAIIGALIATGVLRL